MSKVGDPVLDAARPLALVADDDPIFRSLVVSRLSRMSCGIIEAADGASAWRAARGRSFDLAIIDFEMPALNGIELIGCLRGHRNTNHVPIIMCTSRTDRTAMEEALSAGLTSFLTKPINWNLFDAHISHLLHLGGAGAAGEREVAMLKSIIAGVRDVLVGEASAADKLSLIEARLDGLPTSDGEGLQSLPPRRGAVR